MRLLASILDGAMRPSVLDFCAHPGIMDILWGGSGIGQNELNALDGRLALPAACFAPNRLAVVTVGDTKGPVGIVANNSNGLNLIVVNLADLGL